MMSTATARFTLRGEVKHYPDNTYQASIWLDDEGESVESYPGALSHSPQAAIDSAAETYRLRNRLPNDELVHVVMTDKYVGVLTPECQGASCTCHQERASN